MRHRKITYGLLFALVHFLLLWLAMYESFAIFKGPSTPGEIFWDRVAGVLLFPASLLIALVDNSTTESVLMGLNSLLWGFLIALCFLAWRKGKSG
jgi:hypothetical protein